MTSLSRYLRDRGYNPDGTRIDRSGDSSIVGFIKPESVKFSPKTYLKPKPVIVQEVTQPIPSIKESDKLWEQDFVKEPDRLRQMWVDTPRGKFLVAELWALKYLGQKRSHKVAQFHRQIWRDLCFESYYCEAIFRGSGKSYVTTFEYLMWAICNFVWRVPVVVSQTAEISQEFGRLLAMEFANNQLIRNDYSHLYPLVRDSADVLQFATGQVAFFKGLGYQVRGLLTPWGRPDLGIIEDPENNDSVRSDVMRRSLEEYILGSFIPAMNPVRHQIVVVGNIFNRLCLTNKIRTYEDGKFAQFKTYAPSAEYKDEKGERRSIWPSMWPIEKLDQRKALIGWRQYQCEYMNNPVSSDYAMIKEDCLRYYEKLPAAKYECFISVDPAGAKVEPGRNKSRDYSAICVLLSPVDFLKEELRDFYVWYWIRFRKSLPYVAEFVTNLYFEYRRWYSTHILGEEHGMYSISDEIGRCFEKRAAISQGVVKRIMRSKTTGDLELRMSKLLGLFEAGRVFFKPNMKPLIDEELLPFPWGQHDDTLSALEIALTHVNSRRFS